MHRIGPLTLVLLLLAACGSDPEPEGAAVVDPIDLLARSADAMEQVDSARFEMERSGAQVTVQGLTFDGAVGEYQAPDSARAILEMRASDLAVELGTISIGPRTWLTNPLTGAWEELEFGTGFNPAMLFDLELGWGPLLRGMTAVEYLERDGDHHLVRGTVDGDRIDVLTAGIADPQPVPLDIRLDAGDLRLRRLDFATNGAEGESNWVILLGPYDIDVDIREPGAG